MKLSTQMFVLGQSHLQLPAAPLPKMRRFSQKNWITHTVNKPRDNPSCNKGVGIIKKKKDQAFLSEQQLSSCTWSPAAIFNKMLLFNIVYCQQPVVIFSWTMHTQASKSLSSSLKLGRIFQYLSRTPQWHYLTPPLLSYLSDNIP